MTGLVLLRVRAHRLLLAVTLLTVVLTTCVLTALGAFTGAVGDAGLRRTLEHQAVARTLLEVRASVSSRNREQLDAVVRKAAADAYDGLPVRVAASTRSGPYSLPLALRSPAEMRSGDPDLTLLATFDLSQVTMVEGKPPGRTPARGEPLPVALPETAARALGLRTGDRITLADRQRGGSPQRVRLTGIYRPADRDAPYWRLDRLAGHGVSVLGYTTYGPMLVDPSAFTSGRLAPAEMSWQARADFSAMTTARIGAVRDSVRRAVARIQHNRVGGGAQTSTDLPDLLSEVERSLLVSRSTLLIGALQLAVLAGFALLLVARSLTEERTGEIALLRARGGSSGRLVALAAGEALLLALSGAVAAVLLAGPLVRLLAAGGVLARAGLRFSVPLDSAALWVSGATALACAVAIITPALLRQGAYGSERVVRTRRKVLPGAARAGADLGLLLIAGLAYWQLSRRAEGSGVLSADRGGALGVDPLLVAAPALCLLAGSVLVIRLLPLAARLAERRAAGGRGLAPALAGWQVSRRPGRIAGPVFLLVLMVAMGVFAVGQGASWDRSQRDQAAYAVGADLRVTGSTTPAFGEGGVYDGLPGIASVMPTARTEVTLPQDRLATVLAVDTTRAPGVVHLRPDLADSTPRQLFAPLRPGHRPNTGFVLPDGAGRLRITARLEATGPRGRPVRSTVQDSLTAVVQDRYGVLHPFTLGDLPADGVPHVLTLDFAAAADAAGAPAGPLRLTGLVAQYTLPHKPEHHRLTVTTLRAVASDGTTTVVPAPADPSWKAEATVEDPDFRESPARGYHGARSRPLAIGSGGDVLSARYDTGAEPTLPAWSTRATAVVTLRAATPRVSAVPGVATDAFLRAAGTKAGGTAVVHIADIDLRVRITGSVRSLPTTPPDGAATSGGALLLDLDAVNRAVAARSVVTGLEPNEWWLAAGPGMAKRVAATLRDRSDATSVLVREERESQLSAHPLGVGPRSALPATALAAAVLAAAGLAVTTTGAVRERTGEFAVLRALGTPRRRIAQAISTEQGVLVLVAVGAGAVLGTLLTRLVVPLIVLTTQATRPAPEVVVVLPPVSVAALLTAVAVTVLLIAAAATVRRSDPEKQALRQGTI